jgi:hypothetical protein
MRIKVYKYCISFLLLTCIQINLVFSQISAEALRLAKKYSIEITTADCESTGSIIDCIRKKLILEDSALSEKSSLIAEIYSQNHYNNYGRTYGENQSATGIDCKYKNKTGLGAYLGAESWSALGTKPAFYNLGADYEKDLSVYFGINLYAERWFFPASDKIGKNNLNQELGCNFIFYLGNFTQEINAEYIWNKAHAFTLETRSHYLFEKYAMAGFRRVSLEPEFTLSSGTPNAVYQRYRKITDASGVRRNLKNEYGISKGIYVLSYQFSLPVSFYTKRFIFSLSANYTHPVHLFQGENLKPIAWLQAGIKYFMVRGIE